MRMVSQTRIERVEFALCSLDSDGSGSCEQAHSMCSHLRAFTDNDRSACCSLLSVRCVDEASSTHLWLCRLAAWSQTDICSREARSFLFAWCGIALSSRTDSVRLSRP